MGVLFKIGVEFSIFLASSRKIGFATHLILVKGEAKYADNFDCTFDARQRRIKYICGSFD